MDIEEKIKQLLSAYGIDDEFIYRDKDDNQQVTGSLTVLIGDAVNDLFKEAECDDCGAYLNRCDHCGMLNDQAQYTLKN